MGSVNDYSFKELYDVALKTTYPIEINGISYQEGETVAVFDKIAIADFSEDKQFITAHGGYEDRNRVFWETTKDVRVTFSQGVFSKTDYAILNNAKLIRRENQIISIHQREKLESDEYGKIILKYMPNDEPIKVYCGLDKIPFEFSKVSGKAEITIAYKYQDVVIDYSYNYTGNNSIMTIGEQLFKGFLTLQGKTRIKDDVTGQTVTAIINIPKLKLTSQLSMRLGQNANPIVGRFSALACPTGARGNSKVIEIIYLDNDIDADIM